MLPERAPRGAQDIERFLLEELPAMGPAPRGEEGLVRARRFFAAAGDPQDSARQIHIVGTAGKGTAAAAIIGRLVGAGAAVASHMSPHVYDIRERFLLNGQLPSWNQVEDALDDLWPALREIEDQDGRPPSFFELTTGIAWSIGRAAGATYLVTEAGIGGEFDATNSIAQPDKITVIMPIGYDHLEILGHELAGIAKSKAAVIPESGRVVVAPQPWPEAAAVVDSIAAERHAAVHRITDAHDWQQQAAEVASIVLHLLDAETPGSLDLDSTAAPVHAPGRLERIDAADRVVILDGAHNPMKLRSLRGALPATAVAVVALSAEKDLEACAIELATLAPTIVTCQFAVTASGRVVRQSWPSAELADAIRKANPTLEVVESTDVEAGTLLGLELADAGDTVIATGSFMMLEPARAAALEHPAS